MFKPSDYLDLGKTEHSSLFEKVEHVWEAISRISSYLKSHLRPVFRGKRIGEPFVDERVYIGEGTIIEPGAYIKGPTWIGESCVIRHGAYIRGNVIAGNGCVLGNSCEFKNCVLLDDVEVPHFSYVGDSILGHEAHLGAGVILSNLKLDKSNVQIFHEGKTINTGLQKFGAIVGDRCEVGTNSVLNPGSILGRDSLIYPGTSWKGVLPAGSIVRGNTEYRVIPRKGF